VKKTIQLSKELEKQSRTQLLLKKCGGILVFFIGEKYPGRKRYTNTSKKKQ